MGCATSRAGIAEPPGQEWEEKEVQYDNPGPTSPASKAPAPSTPTPAAPRGSTSGAKPSTTAAKSAQKGGQDGSVATALRSKRKGFVVDGTSVQVGASFQRRIIPKDQAVRDGILRSLQGNMLFAGYGSTALNELVDAMEPRNVSAGTVIIQQGEPGDNFYAIEAGKVGSWGPFPPLAR